jgi:transposase
MDEARFGRISELRQCWAPAGERPVVPKQVIRESIYAYAALGVKDGLLLHQIRPKVNADGMNEFIAAVAKRTAHDRVLFVLDGAGWHKSSRLRWPTHIRPILLPPYSPELNPVERLWDELREKWFANRLFLTLRAVEIQLNTGLALLADSRDRMRSLVGYEDLFLDL